MSSQITGYSEAEVTAAAAALVQSRVSVQRDSLGPVDVGNQFQEAVDLVTTTLVNDPNSIFYLMSFSASSAADALASVVAAAQDLLKAVSEIAGATKPITNTTLLGDAAAALIEIDAILSKDSVIQRASYDRFIKSVDAFRDVSLAPNIAPSSTTGVSRSRPEAVQAVYDHLLSLRTTYPDVFQKVRALGSYLGTFLELELRKAAAATTIGQARQSLTDMQTMFEDENTSDAVKVAQARTAYLQLAAAKAVVKGVHLVVDPSLPKLDATTGSGTKLFKNLPESHYDQVNQPFIMQDAFAVGRHAGPWKLQSGLNQLLVAANGQAEVAFDLPIQTDPTLLSEGGATSYTFTDTVTAQLVGGTAGSFDIPASPGNVFTLIVDGVVYSGSLTSGMQSTATVISDILAISGLSSVLSVTDGGSGNIVLETVSQGSTAGIIVRTLGDLLGFSGTGAYASGTDYNRRLIIDGNQLMEMPLGTLSTADVAAAITAAFPTGPFSATAYTDGKRILLQRTGHLKFKMSLPPVGGSFDGHSYEELARCFALLGFQDGQVGQTQPVTAQQISEFLNASPAFQALHAVASVSKEVTTSTGATLTIEGLECTVLAADTVRFPAAEIPDAFIQNYLSTSPDILSVNIKSGYNNSVCRMISMLSHDSSYVQMQVDPIFPLDSAQAATGYAIEKDTLKVTSTAWSTPGSTTSTLTISGYSAALMGIDGAFYGFTNGVVFFPETGSPPSPLSSQFYATARNLGLVGVGKGDLLWRPNSDDTGQDGVDLFTVTGIFTEPDVTIGSGDNKVLTLTLPGLSLRPTVSDPGWVIYSYEAFGYKYFIEKLYPQIFGPYLQQTRAKPFATGSTAELDRVMNPLLVNTQSSNAQINDARTTIQDFLYTVAGLAAVCSAVSAHKVARIDSALGMLQERGFDLAYKALSTGDLVGFLSMDKDDASSSAAMLKASRAVVQNDTPISKTSDDADIGRTHQTTAYSPDASYDYSDVAREDPLNLIGASVTIDADDPAADQVAGKTLSG